MRYHLGAALESEFSSSLTSNANKQEQLFENYVELARESRAKRAKLQGKGKSGWLASAQSHSLHQSAVVEIVSIMDKAKAMLIGKE